MGYYKTEYCFFTGMTVISCDEKDGKFLDGYYYRVEYKGKVLEFKLSHLDNWKDDEWLKKHREEFVKLLELFERWDFFKEPRSLKDVLLEYVKLKNRSIGSSDE